MFGWSFGNAGNIGGGDGGGGFFGLAPQVCRSIPSHTISPQRSGKFEQEYNCYPSSFLGRDDIDKGNKIILPTSALETLARLNISYPMLFEVCTVTCSARRSAHS